jgi:hypothetical protein
MSTDYEALHYATFIHAPNNSSLFKFKYIPQQPVLKNPHSVFFVLPLM